MSARFPLDPRLAGDTHDVAALPFCELLLMDDARYPWLILVPRKADATELIDLDADEQRQLMTEIDRVARALRALTSCHKLNVAALGNAVAQLHVHVIARFRDDAAWPKPVWGVAPARRYEVEALEQLRTALHAGMFLSA